MGGLNFLNLLAQARSTIALLQEAMHLAREIPYAYDAVRAVQEFATEWSNSLPSEQKVVLIKKAGERLRYDLTQLGAKDLPSDALIDQLVEQAFGLAETALTIRAAAAVTQIIAPVPEDPPGTPNG